MYARVRQEFKDWICHNLYGKMQRCNKMKNVYHLLVLSKLHKNKKPFASYYVGFVDILYLIEKYPGADTCALPNLKNNTLIST